MPRIKKKIESRHTMITLHIKLNDQQVFLIIIAQDLFITNQAFHKDGFQN